MDEGNSGGIDASVGGNVDSKPTLRPFATACSIIASLGLSTGIGACARATASMQGPKAEQVNKIASEPVPAAYRPSARNRSVIAADRPPSHARSADRLSSSQFIHLHSGHNLA